MHSQLSQRRFDLSRDTFDPTKLYRSIIKQQGRVTVDADDNEQRRIELHRSDLTTLDVIGPCGYPEGGTGFEIGVASGGMTLDVGLGRMYVHGMLVENFNATSQFLLDPSGGGTPSFLTVQNNVYQNLATGTYLAYLDVWERDITAVDDPNIRETALGGPDTAARTELVAQIHLTPVASGATCATALLPSIPNHTGTLTAQTDPAAAAQDCTLPPLAGFRGQENQLYRVEIQEGGAVGTATYKWERENGCVYAAITGPSSGLVGQSFTVQSLGADSTLGFSNNEWIELLDDDVVLLGQPGYLAYINNVDPGTLTITLSATSPTGVISYAKNPRIRRWDQTDPSATNGVLTATAFTDLENGVQVSFGGGTFYPGDYWMIPARTAIDQETGTLDYPTTAQPALYTDHHFCSLGVIAYNVTTGWGTPTDCRIPFPPLTGLPTMGGGCCVTVTVGDGTTSVGQYTDIATAIAALPSQGGVVGIEAGNYSVTSPISVPNNVTLRGCKGRTFVRADNGAFVVNGNDVAIENLTIQTETAAAIATPLGTTVSNLAVSGNAISSQEGKSGYGISFSATVATIKQNALRRCGIEVQPASTDVVIVENEILESSVRGISIGSVVSGAAVSVILAKKAAAKAKATVQYTSFASKEIFSTTFFDPQATSATLGPIRIGLNTIEAAALEGIGAETLITTTDNSGNTTQEILICQDVTIVENNILACLRAEGTPPSGAILIPTVERFSVWRNLIEANGPYIAASGIASLIALGSDIRDNRILQNGAGASSTATFGLGAIELYLAGPAPDVTPFDTLPIDLPAATISGNIVSANMAPALYMPTATGQVSVTDNDFTVVGVSEASPFGTCVYLANYGSGSQESQTPTYTTDSDVSGGQILFSGNRCLFDGRNAGTVVYGAVVIVSSDGIVMDDNVSRCFVLASSANGTAGFLYVNFLAQGNITQISGNRFSEDFAFASAAAAGADTIAIGNHGTHCMYFNATGTLANQGNIVNPLNAANCESVAGALWA